MEPAQDPAAVSLSYRLSKARRPERTSIIRVNNKRTLNLLYQNSFADVLELPGGDAVIVNAAGQFTGIKNDRVVARTQIFI